MSTTIDNKVVEMRFDNKQFEANVQTSLSTLDKLKQKLNLTNTSKGLENLNTAAKNVNMSGLGNAIDTVHAKFSALEVIGVTALANITNSAINAGKKMVSALTIEPVMTGFQEYETQINAVQTILANTQSKGSTLNDVNAALDELNTYADKTIYNFTEMTRNIGTFTAAGVDLDKSVSSIKGIANLAAVSGSTSQQASTAMYQLSQALAAGKVQLMDWNSVVNAGMGGQVFQDALIRTSEHLKTGAKEAIDTYGSFRESLTKTGWLTSEVLTETLSQLSGAYSEADLIAQGYSEKQAKEITELAETAVNAATKVKTFTQLWDTLKEAAQSGWTQSWEIIIGDFEEAKSLLTEVSETIGGIITSSAESRNKLLGEGLSSGWKQLLGAGIADEEGYIESIKKVAREHGDAFDKMVKEADSFDEALKKGLEDGTITSDTLSEAVTNLANKMRGASEEERKAAGYTEEHIEQIEALESGLKDGSISMDEFVDKMNRLSGRENLIEALRNSFHALADVIKPVSEAFREIFPPYTGEQLYALTEKIKDFTAGLKISDETADKFKRTFKGIFSIFDIFRKIVSTVVKTVFDLLGSEGIGSIGDFLLDKAASIGDFFTSLNNKFDIGGISGGLSEIVSGISNVLKNATEGISGFGDILSSVGQVVSDVAGKVWDKIKTVFTWITDNVSVSDVFAGLAGGGIFVLAKKLSGVLEKVKEILDNIFNRDKSGSSDIGGKFTEVLDSVHGALESFTTGIKISSLLGIAVAIGILSLSLKTISKIKPEDVTKSLFAIGAMLTMLNVSFRSITKSLKKFGSKGIVKSAIALILVAEAINILSDALVKLADLSMSEIAKGLIAVGGGLGELSVGLKIIGKTKISLSTSIAMLALAESCNILGDALKKFGEMSWDEIGRGLPAMGGALGEVVAALAILSKVGGGSSLLGSISILIAVQSLGELSESLKKFGEMSWEEIGRGLTAMGGALGELGVVIGVLGKLAGFSGILGSGAILITIQGLDQLADALKKFGEMSWEEIGRGLTAMGGALGEVATVSGLLGKLTGFSGILGSGAILLGVQSLGDLADALKKFGEMSWEEIGRGLTAMGGALGEVATVSGLLGGLTGLSGILGSGAILLGVQGLGDIADALKKFGDMDWEEIGRGLTAMGGALTELGVISGLLGTLAPLAVLGSGSLLLGVQGLGDLADALKKFGEMSWEEIGHGLAAMGSAMSEVALGGLMNTLSGLGAASIAEVAPALGTLADSVKKWTGVTVPDGLGAQIGSLSEGILSFTFGGSGAGALAKAAPAVGTMADSVKKWAGVTVPEGIQDRLTELAYGVEAWTWAFAGGWSIGAAVEPLKNLAGSIKAWSDVTVPEGIQDRLTGLADGVKAWTWAFMGDWSIGAVIEPLKSLAGAIKAWNDVAVPEGMEERLTGLADGVKAWTWAFVGSWSIGAVVEPLKNLAGAVKSWNGVSIQSDLGAKLESLAEGAKALGNVSVGDLSGICDGIRKIGGAANDISGVNFGAVADQLSKFASSVSNIKVSGDSFANLGKKIVNGFVSAINSGKGRVQSAVTSLANTAVKSFSNAVSGAAAKSSSAGTAMVRGLANGMKSGMASITSTISIIINSVIKAITSKASIFQSSGVTLIAKLVSGITSRSSSVSSTVSSLVKGASSSVRGSYSSFYNNGAYLGSGLVIGIRSKIFSAYLAGYALGKAAVQGEKDGQQSKSPSKLTTKAGKWLGEGLIIGMKKIGSKVYESGYKLGDSAANSMSKAISKASNLISAGVDVEPTIRPILDLSDIESGASAISGILGSGSSIGVSANINAINTMMNRRNQNGASTEIVSAINKLRKDLGNINHTSYNINGITYDDGSNISNAVRSLVRAAKVERRI